MDRSFLASMSFARMGNSSNFTQSVPKAAGVRVNVLLQSRAVRQVAGAVRVAGEHPRFTQGVHLALDAVLGTQFFAAPEVVLAAWFQLNRFHLAYLQYA